MAYLTQSDMVDRLGEPEMIALTDMSGSGAINSAIVTRALEEASSLVDSYLSRRYAVPVDPAPPALLSAVADIAHFTLNRLHAPDAVIARHKAALAWLQKLADGSAELVGVAGVEATEAAPSGGLKVSAPDRRVSASDLDQFRGRT